MKLSEKLKFIEEYYFSRKLEEVRLLEAQGKNIINLGIGSPDLPPSEETVNELIKSVKIPKNHSYQPYHCIKELRKAIADWYLKTYSVKIDPDIELLPLLGSKEGIFYLSMALLNNGDEVLVPDPGYPAYSSSAFLSGANVRPYNLTEENRWLPDIDEIEKIKLNKLRLMWINYPNMPTGARSDKSKFDEIAEFAQRHSIVVCNDNPYSLVLNDSPISFINSNKINNYCVELNSFSKSFNMAGWRIGLMIAGKEIINAVIKVKSNVDSGMFKPLQEAAIIALNNSNQWHTERNDIYRKRREYIYRLLDILNCSYAKHQSGMFIWAKVPEDIADAEKFLDRVLYQAGVFMTPGKIFGKNGERFIRVSLCSSEQNIVEAIHRINKILT